MNSILKRLRSRRLASAFLVLATFSVAILAGSYAAHGVRGQERQNSSSDATPLHVVNSPVTPNEFVKIAKEVGPAVVNINTVTLPKQTTARRNPHGLQRVPAQPQQSPDSGDDDDDNGAQQAPQNPEDFFRHFFGGQAPDQDGGDDQTRESLGSGFIVDSKGYIVTNSHVIEKADKIYVKLSTDDPDSPDQGRIARVIGVDKSTDLAVIKIDTDKPLPTVKLGNSDNVQVGDWVEAIGSPFALAQTVTAGIISAKNRTIEPGARGQFQHFLQTDAAINPGNSGGPLLNMNGEVIGINTAIYTQSAGYQGIGFAMPSNTVVQVYNDLISPSHKVTRGSIGITFKQSISSIVNRVYGFQAGVIVSSVQPGGPAEKAGLKPRDIIIAIDGSAIKNGDDLVNQIASRRPGSSVRLGVLRDDKRIDVTVTIGDRDQIFADLNNPKINQTPEEEPDAGDTKLGIVVRDASPSIVSHIHSPAVIIQSVRNGSFADLQGLEPGLAIIRINKQPTGSRDQFNAIVGKLKTGDDVVLEVMDPRRPADGINYVAGPLQ